ncbi:MAG TPA: hypothetical protein VGH62_08855 [Bradyrhizobium sp.]
MKLRKILIIAGLAPPAAAAGTVSNTPVTNPTRCRALSAIIVGREIETMVSNEAAARVSALRIRGSETRLRGK